MESQKQSRTPRRASESNPNWTLTEAERGVKHRPATGLEIERGRKAIEGTRSALKQFAVRNQHIVVDPFPASHHCPKAVPIHRNPLLLDAEERFPSRRNAFPPSREGFVSNRVTYNPALQKYESRPVVGPRAQHRGLASEACCFAVDRSLNGSGWHSTMLNVDDVTHPQERRLERRSSPSASFRSDVRDINFPSSVSPRQAALERRRSPSRVDAASVVFQRAVPIRPKPVPARPEWWGC